MLGVAELVGLPLFPLFLGGAVVSGSAGAIWLIRRAPDLEP
jgi:hypothetical protein